MDAGLRNEHASVILNNVVKLHITRKEEETMTQKKFSTKYLVEMALLVAIILIMAFTPIGYIRTAGLEITLIVVPVAVGAVTLGPAAGAILGGVFGVTSFIQCFGMSPFGAALLGINGFLTFLVCVPTRILMGWLTGLIYKGLRKTKLPSGASVTISNLCCPLLNTTFFMGMLVIGFYNTEYIQSFVSALGAKNALLFILAFVGVNGLVEAIVCFVVGTAISAALKKALKYRDFALKNKNPCSACEFQAKQGISIWGIKLLFFSV